jgi:hypothetical protein
MGTKFQITTAGINAQHQTAALAVAQYRHTKAYAAALVLAAALLRYNRASEFYQYHADASRLIQLAAQYATPEKVILRMTAFALEFTAEFEAGLEGYALDQEMARVFVRLAPKSKRGNYVRERTLLIIAELLRETVWPYCYGLAYHTHRAERDRIELLKVSKTIATEKPNGQANVALKE